MKVNPSKFKHVLRPLEAAEVVGDKPVLKEPRILGNWALWLEQRPVEGGRTTALIRPWARPDLPVQELTKFPINLRSRVHTYGGGPLATTFAGNELFLVWVDDCDGCLWFQTWQESSRLDEEVPWFNQLSAPVRLSSPGEYCFADGLIDFTRRRWLGVMEHKEKDYLVSFSLDKEAQQPLVIYEPTDFLGYLALSPDGAQLAWVEWQQPNMPWDSSQLWWASLTEIGDIIVTKILAGTTTLENKSVSVFQPIWLADRQLLVAEDSSGWWNLMMTTTENLPSNQPVWRRNWPMDAETAVPQWVYGMSTNSLAGENILSLICNQGLWAIKLLSFDGNVREFDQPFDDLSGLKAFGDKAIAIASNSAQGTGLLEIDVKKEIWMHSPLHLPLLEDDHISHAQSFWFKGFQGELTHSWYYPPQNVVNQAAPLLVKIHSGPTAMACKGLQLGIQFWTSRGWGVVDVNYGGSTGFGRSYRERLKGRWGEIDVADCSAVAKALVAEGKADPRRIAIEGSSAGGFTALACLSSTDIFRVAACKYGVTDLVKMNTDTHRFESGYLDYLLGDVSSNMETYQKRSPIENAETINCPIIFFQGLKDKVVLPEQTERMANILRSRNIPVQVHTFSEEAHGFRDANVKVQVLQQTEIFFRRQLNI